jgi:hypothetical protein
VARGEAVIDAFLVFFLVSIVPLAFIGVGGRTGHALLAIWRVAQFGTLALAFAFVLYKLARSRWQDIVLFLAIIAAVAVVGLSYSNIAWDAQIEYHRIVLLTEQWHSLYDAYVHGMSTWIVGYPPGTSLSVMWYRWLHLISPNVAQEVLLVLWCGAFMIRHMQRVDTLGKVVFFALVATTPLFQWHVTYFYNNLFYALICAQLVLAPLFGSSIRPWELSAYALVLVCLRPQWEIAAISITSSALATVLAATPPLERRRLRDAVVAALVALMVARYGAIYWKHAEIQLVAAQEQHKLAIAQQLAATQPHDALEVQVQTKAVEQLAPPLPPLLSRESLGAIAWAWNISTKPYASDFVLLGGVGLLALATLRRRGLPLLVPWLSPLGLIAGTAVFAHSQPTYRANAWALERLQIVVPILAAGSAAALYMRLRARTRA